MIDTYKIFDELQQAMEVSAAKKITEVLTLIYEDLQNTVTRTELKELKDVVKELAEAQKETEQTVRELAAAQNELAMAQKETEQTVKELAAAQNELAVAQKETEQRINELAAAQKETEQRINELAAAQKKTEQAVNELAEAQKELAAAQKRTEREVRNLARQVAGLSERLGGSLEDISYDVLPACLEKYYQIEVEELGRDFISVNGKVIEVNILGNGVDKTTGRAVTVIGEVKTNITLKEVKRFVQILEKVRGSIEGELFPVLFGFRIHLDAREFAKANNIRMFVSYGKEIK